MSYKAHKISTNLYQGGLPPVGDALSRAGIDVLVLCAADYQNAAAYEGVEVILAPGDDDARPHRLKNFIDNWKSAAEQVAQHVNDGKQVLVTCFAGQNRSGLVVALALGYLTNMSGKDIVDHIQKCRPHALNNETFVDYIIKNIE